MTGRVAVVGGGAVGVTAAHDLAVDGADVTLYERDDLGSGASGRAAGIVYDAFAEDRDAAVAARALERFRALDADDAIDLTPCPYVWLAREGDDTTASSIREQVPRMETHGRPVEVLDRTALADRFSGLDCTDVAVAAVTTEAGYLDPGSYVTAMAERARDAGVEVRTGVEASVTRTRDGPVVGTDVGESSFDAVLVAAGAHSGQVLADAGYRIPMKPYRVQALVTDPLPVVETGPAPPVPMTFDASAMYYFRPRDGGLLVGDGTEEREFDPDAYDETADRSFLSVSRGRLGAALGVDAGDVTVTRAWAGLCTATPDRNPLLGPVDDGVFVATGWQGHGFMRAPALGEAIADQVRGGEGIEAFDPRRFEGDEEFDVFEGMSVDERTGEG